MSTQMNSILIANRGEIACRIIRSAKALGLRTIAVYSDADVDAPHVRAADEAVRLGPAPAAGSYLDSARVLAAARDSGAAMIHPGYGFLSENAPFATACEKAGLVFVGPLPEAITLMGDKAKAKRAMIKAGIACIPGYQGKAQSDDALIRAAKDIGYPIMIKAAAGGGGRGMRLVQEESALKAALGTARSEAENAFGEGALILERALVKARHIEVQILADGHGNTVHLGTRDCSVQRRHQKIIEEAPAPGLTPELSEAMGAVAVKAAQDIDYVGAGTIEFLLDPVGDFYFLEMNTRLQVEHPVTEMITGLDLVALQIRIAQGEALPFAQGDVKMSGHGIEARLYAEDPAQDFLPSSGKIALWRPLRGGGIRVDSGVRTGSEITPFYDPLMAKIITHGKTREDARQKLVRALKNTHVFGPATNKHFLIRALETPDFVQGHANTGFIETHFDRDALSPAPLTFSEAAMAAVLMFDRARTRAQEAAISMTPALHNWASATPISTPYAFAVGEETLNLFLTPKGPDVYEVRGPDETTAHIRVLDIRGHKAVLEIDGHQKRLAFHQAGARISVSIKGREFHAENLCALATSSQKTVDSGSVIAPMHGLLGKVLVKPGDTVCKGAPLAILEAMKMQHELCAGINGTIKAVHAKPGTQIAAHTVLIEIESSKT
ncbi:MAG: acetyl-CoA carboxylase biotin carboxylase subunit [Robiginitomaculum sp.]|nr:acetyl-CoA carboxylase biotin carboxylase subunit [Robiginitomaculum sp.]MDQ7076684.1 acetyl-CoA carboxylase biotin carboxylase subunit [Robiginitomaculum sp.]